MVLTAGGPSREQDVPGQTVHCQNPFTVGPDLMAPHPLLDISITPDKGGGILRRESSHRRHSRRQVRFDVSNQSKNRTNVQIAERPSLGPLELPRMHSTEALKQEVERESEQEFDAESALRNQLGRSFKARRSVDSKAAKALNVCRVQNLYQGLVSVEPPAEQIQRLTEKPRKAELKHVTPMEGPDLFAFYKPSECHTETPYLNVDGLPALTALPHSRPPRCSFDMVYKLGEWAS
ncbi:Hypothetical predicted protein [Pelobates cultripes]|uniref:Protein phosphatase 1 regulatory subunit 35 C-terminal domain-containing protein n=1 Tax=Pelobates cultripes TaxID=61616 RepID=A0AAD1VUV9_PELCU|nr:Hypothetical predicted protein [Pelobates cultripes]